MRRHVVNNRWAIWLLLFCLAANAAHALSHTLEGHHLLSYETSSITECDNSDLKRVASSDTCLACESFHAVCAPNHYEWVTPEPPRPVANVTESPQLLMLAALAKSHGERGPPRR